MRRVLLCAMLAGCNGTTLHGQIVDAMNDDAPLAGEVVIARAVGTAELTCQTLTGITDDDGKFIIPGLCLAQTAYRLEAANKALLLGDVDTVDSAGQVLLIHAWWAPAGNGAYLLRGRDLTPLGTAAELRTVQIGGETVAYPTVMPDGPAIVTPTDHLVFTGEEATTYVLAPLVPSGPRMFGAVPMEPWSYVGVRFIDDTTFERVAAVPDPAKVRDLVQSDRSARFVGGDALPPGVYIAYTEGSRHAAIIQFGTPSVPVPVPVPVPDPAPP